MVVMMVGKQVLKNNGYNNRVKIAPFGRWDAQKARALYPYRYAP